MKTAAICVALSLAIGGNAFAAERVPTPHPSTPACITLDKLKADLKGIKGGAKFTPLNIGQFRVMEGAYAATPPIGLPLDTDNAFLLQLKGKNLIVWMKEACASPTAPMPIPDQFVAILKTISPVAGEASDAADDANEERKL